MMHRLHRVIGLAAIMGSVGVGGYSLAGDLPSLDLETYVSGLSLPVGFVQDPRFENVQYIVQQRGLIRRVIDGSLSGTDFMSLVGIVSSFGSEQGLLGLAFPVDPNDDRFYVNYTRISDGATVVARYERLAADPMRGDPASAEILMITAQPFSNHNGGHIAFGPDGYLYIGHGDGGGAGDSGNRAQTRTTHLGKMLRIDVSPANGYVVPPDNPFVDNIPVDALDEIWAFGLRNPWKFSFDWHPALGPGAGSGALIIGDVGQDAWEEINYEPANSGGRNYGWRNREGRHPFNNTQSPAYTPLIDPQHEVQHPIGGSITGGYIYRGSDLGASYYGRYFFGDFLTRRVWSFIFPIDPDTGEAGNAVDVIEHTTDLGGSNAIGNPSAFGVDAAGELYIVNYNGVVNRVITPKIVVQPQSFTRVRGNPVSGDLGSLLFSDDDRLVTRPDVFRATTTPPVQVEVTGLAPLPNPSSMSVTIETSASVNNIQQRVLFWNFQTSDWEAMDVRLATLDDSTLVVEVPSPERFINQNTGEVRVSIRCVAVAFSLSPNWLGRIDVVEWSMLD